MTISIITPAYNPGSLIYETFESLEKQTYKDFEWVIVDDCSNQENKDIFKNIQKQASFSVVIISNKTNLKQAKSKNIGLNYAKGKYIKFLDADDLLDRKHLENQLKQINKLNDEYAIYSPTANFTNTIDNSSINTHYKYIKNNNISQLNEFLVYPFFSHCSCLFHKSSLLNILGFNEKLITDEDGDLIIRLMLNNILFVVEDKSCYYYRQHNKTTRVSLNDNEEKWKARLDVCLEIENKLNGKYKNSKEALAQRLDTLGLACFEYSQNLAQEFFENAKRIYPNYSKPGNFLPKLIRTFFGIRGYYFFKNLKKQSYKE